MSFLRGFLSSPTEVERQQGGLEAIEKLCERLETATLLDDRRDAIRALRALSKVVISMLLLILLFLSISTLNLFRLKSSLYFSGLFCCCNNMCLSDVSSGSRDTCDGYAYKRYKGG